MIKPTTAIAEVFEAQENVEVIIIKGGSGNLLRSIEVNGVGDLYLPGDEIYIQTAKEKGLIVEQSLLGYNRAALMVQEGNPRGITAELENLTNPAYYVVLGNPDSGSIGKETRRILENAGLYEDVLANTHELTTDSKDLVAALVEKRADLLINWYAVSVWDENERYMDVLPINPEIAPRKKLILTTLTTAREPELAQLFLEYAASNEGLLLFEAYGFGLE